MPRSPEAKLAGPCRNVCSEHRRTPRNRLRSNVVVRQDKAPQKLLVVITADLEADALIKALVERGYPATKVSSTGGFLRRGSATILSGVEQDDVDNVLAIVRRECRARTERVPQTALPFPQGVVQEPAEVRVGGAIVFVLPVDHFEKT